MPALVINLIFFFFSGQALGNDFITISGASLKTDYATNGVNMVEHTSRLQYYIICMITNSVCGKNKLLAETTI